MLAPQMQIRNDMYEFTLPLLPFQFLGVRSVIRYGVQAGFALTLCSVAMLSNLQLTISFSSLRTCCITSAISCLIWWCKLTMSAAATMPALLRLLLLRQNIESPWLAPLAPTLSGAPLPRQVEIYCVAQPEPTRMRWCVCDKC